MARNSITDFPFPIPEGPNHRNILAVLAGRELNLDPVVQFMKIELVLDGKIWNPLKNIPAPVGYLERLNFSMTGEPAPKNVKIASGIFEGCRSGMQGQYPPTVLYIPIQLGSAEGEMCLW